MREERKYRYLSERIKVIFIVIVVFSLIQFLLLSILALREFGAWYLPVVSSVIGGGLCYLFYS